MGMSVQGSELFDGEGIYDTEDFLDKNEEEQIVEGELLEVIDRDIPIETVKKDPNKESDSFSGNSILLDEKNINNNAKFLEKVKK